MNQGNGKPEAATHAELVEAIAEEVCNKLWLSVHPTDKPDWVSRIVRIPERRLRQILGVFPF